MKKVSLVLGMVLAVSMAMAQNTATTRQIGNGDGATLNQSGTSNTGVVLQLKGDDNTGTLLQSGSSNNANMYQGIISGYAQSGTIEMAANSNTGYIRQVGSSNNVYDFFQLGDRNTGSVDINGNSNRVEFQQGFTNYDSGDAVLSNDNHASVTQKFDNNFAGLWQWGDGNTSNIAQTGYYNNASVSQGYSYRDQGIAFVPDAQGNVSNVSQVGNYNNIRAMQLGNYNTLSLTQTGNSNIVGGMPGTGLPTYFRQTGDDNSFYGTQTDGATLKATSGQTGSYDYINLSQGAGDNAEIIQAGGNSNSVWLTQGGGGQVATILQTGGSNTASVSQGN